ncbi:imidazole glycerol phosphate synthase subunit HisH [Treponema sp.]|uniref:imidazole glycerol phosphate synthase subunit HisH n=1 Tax=Treponema sp. TaxID=166 RepID=UPI003F0605B7
MTGIVDYNAGNIKSVEHALEFLGASYILSGKPSELENVDRIIFPGVGDAAYAMGQLRETGFDSFLKDWAKSGRPLLGICLGSQIVFDYSEEGDTKCLGLLEGSIRHFSSITGEELPDGLKVPHIGWNNVEFANGGSPLLDGIPSGSDFYFVHSYVIQPSDSSVVKGYADYGIKVPAVVEKDNIAVFQFHPEKSGECGLRILRNFVAADISAEGGI